MEKKEIFNLELMNSVFNANMDLMSGSLASGLVRVMKDWNDVLEDEEYIAEDGTIVAGCNIYDTDAVKVNFDLYDLMEATREDDVDDIFDENLLTFVTNNGIIIYNIVNRVQGMVIYEPVHDCKATVHAEANESGNGFKITLTRK